MPSLVTRFHFLFLVVTLAITGVALIHVPDGYAFPALWRGSDATWLWPRDIALAVAPALEAALMAAFFLLGLALTSNHLARTRHILEPALTLLLAVTTACQFGLLFMGIGSDIDMFRITGFGLAATLLVLAAVMFEAERHSYGGLRLPWPIPSDRAWRLAHRSSAVASALAAIAIGFLAWSDPEPGYLVPALAIVLVGLPLFAGIVTVLTRSL